MAVDYSILESWNIDTSRLLVSIRYRTKVRGSSERKRLTFLVPPPSPSWGEILFEMNYSRNKG